MIDIQHVSDRDLVVYDLVTKTVIGPNVVVLDLTGVDPDIIEEIGTEGADRFMHHFPMCVKSVYLSDE